MRQRIRVWWVEWGDQPPYGHLQVRYLTYDQYQRYRRLQETKSLSAGADYAVKVGSPTGQAGAASGEGKTA